jgi:mannan endo-1,4-beta-mannosidase
MAKRKIILFILLSFLSETTLFSCKKDEIQIQNYTSKDYQISDSKILFKTNSLQLIGANSFHTFGGSSNDMNSWNIDLTREFIGNVKENPIIGNPIKDSNGSWLYSLQNIVNNNRINNRITIICSFGWDGTSNSTFTGKMPRQTTWWNDYKIILQNWATEFKDQPDVWIEVWNEPYKYDRSDGYSDEIWMNDMNELTTIIRNTGNKNIILIPCAEQGQDESVLINKGAAFLSNKSNILFDIHAYEKWLLASDSEITNRLDNLQSRKLPVIFGETAPMNAGVLMNPQSFLNSIYDRGISVCAWTWKYDENDKDALLTLSGLPNNNGNNNWGTTFKNLSSKARNPK